ncbi:MAG: helix-turn-helix domain-containing protein [Pseudomonadota bacterium]
MKACKTLLIVDDDLSIRTVSSLTSETLSQTVNRLLREYFAAHRGLMPPAGLYDRVLREVEKPLIEQTLLITGGNQIRAAAILGLNRNTLRKKINELGIEVRK